MLVPPTAPDRIDRYLTHFVRDVRTALSAWIEVHQPLDRLRRAGPIPPVYRRRAGRNGLMVARIEVKAFWTESKVARTEAMVRRSGWKAARTAARVFWTDSKVVRTAL